MRAWVLPALLAAFAPRLALAQDHTPWPVRERAVIERYVPFFPESERWRTPLKAVVTLELTINANGFVRGVKVTQSAGPEFDAAAVTAGRLTLFAAAKTTTVQPFTVTFELP
jgi:TonB family protein